MKFWQIISQPQEGTAKQDEQDEEPSPKTRAKTAVKAVRAAADSKDKAKAQEVLREAASALQKAAARGVIHKRGLPERSPVSPARSTRSPYRSSLRAQRLKTRFPARASRESRSSKTVGLVKETQNPLQFPTDQCLAKEMNSSASDSPAPASRPRPFASLPCPGSPWSSRAAASVGSACRAPEGVRISCPPPPGIGESPQRGGTVPGGDPVHKFKDGEGSAVNGQILDLLHTHLRGAVPDTEFFQLPVKIRGLLPAPAGDTGRPETAS